RGRGGQGAQAEREGEIWVPGVGVELGKEYRRCGEKRKLNGMNWRFELHTRTYEHPVVCVSWNDSVAFANWLAEKLKIPCRLPSEAEWEVSCRGGTTTPFSTGETISTDQANYDGGLIRQPVQLYPNTGRNALCWNQITPAGKFPPNAWGLY